MTTRTAEMDEMPQAEDSPSTSDMGIDEGYVKALKNIRNDVEQISEISQSTTVVSHEIVTELLKALKLNNRPLKLENSDEAGEIIVHQNGFILIRNREGGIEPRPLIDLEPSFLYAILKRLIPKLKASLGDRKQQEEDLLEHLIKTRDTLI